MSHIIKRSLQLPDLTKHSCFLWGPRKTGKSYWISHCLGNYALIDLLKTDVLADYATRPALLRERYLEHNPDIPIVIDEVQKLPNLLNEVHWLIENKKLNFLLTGSSARKLKRFSANMLGGRARRRELKPLSFVEVPDMDIQKAVISGMLPSHYLSTEPIEDLRSYVADYLKEEILEEGITRNLPAFSEFLRLAALSSGEIINYANISQDIGVAAKTVKSYFEILEDTLLAVTIPAWKRSKTKRVILTNKIYLFDIGVTNYLSKRQPNIGTPEFGKSFEQFILMELIAFKAYRQPEMDIHFWRTSNGHEVDFILNDKEVAIEVKSSKKITDNNLRWITSICEDGPIKKRFVVSLETQKRIISDKHGSIEILPWREFLIKLWASDIL